MSILTKYFPFRGGLNTTAPPLSVTPGELLDCLNYECLQEGGYQRIKGYHLYDGKETPDSVVPGVGPVLGVHVYRGDVYAIRDTATEGRLYKATSTGWVEVDNTFTFSLGGKYSFANYNFYGQDDQEEMFIVNGKDKAVKYNGATLVQLTTGLTEDTPCIVIGFKKHLVLGIQSSIMISSVGDPTNWDAATGSAAEIAVGDTVNDLEVSQGALIIGCRNSTQVLYGNDSSDFRMEPLNKTGVMSRTLQNIGGQLIGVDNSGVMNLQASNAYGNFIYASISERARDRVQRIIEAGDMISILQRQKGQYRLFSGQNGLYFSMTGPQLLGITRVYFNHPVRCATNGEDPQGNEINLFGSDNGQVFLMDSTNYFNGLPIQSNLLLAFHTFGLPTQRKRFRQLNIEMKVDGQTQRLFVLPITDYGGGIAASATELLTRRTGAGLWDFSQWDDLLWDEQYASEGKARINAVGANMGAVFTSEGIEDGIHAFYGATVHYSPRRLKR